MCACGSSSGEHPRFGVLDVCPFIPVRNVTMEDCVQCAREFAERLAVELNVPGKTDRHTDTDTALSLHSTKNKRCDSLSE